jgi:hypothetical protein
MRVLLATALAVGLVGCATPSRFEWGGYEPTLYAYAKSPEARENYRKALVSAIADGEKTNRVAPGMYAELGYLYVEDKNNADAMASFEKEMSHFPESRPFLSSVMARLTGAAPATSSAAAAAPTS